MTLHRSRFIWVPSEGIEAGAEVRAQEIADVKMKAKVPIPLIEVLPAS